MQLTALAHEKSGDTLEVPRNLIGSHKMEIQQREKKVDTAVLLLAGREVTSSNLRKPSSEGPYLGEEIVSWKPIFDH